MEVKEYNNAQTFLDDYESVLLEHESISQLVLYSAYECCQNNHAEQVSFGCVTQAGKPLLFFGNVPPYNMPIYIVPEMNDTASVMMLADYFGNRKVEIKGILANQHVCLEFIEGYKKHIKCSFTEKLGMDLMELRKVNELILTEGTHRLALPEEAKIVAEWMVDFQLEAFTIEMDYQAARSRADKLIAENKVHFYENKDKKVVTMAIATRKLPHGTAITYVFTPEEYRGNGFAAANIHYLSTELLKQGNEYCTLFVDKKNPLSVRAYEKVGYSVIDSIYEYKVVSIL